MEVERVALLWWALGGTYPRYATDPSKTLLSKK